MVSWYHKQRQWYLDHGYSYKEASRHAKADEQWWLKRLGMFTGPHTCEMPEVH